MDIPLDLVLLGVGGRETVRLKDLSSENDLDSDFSSVRLREFPREPINDWVRISELDIEGVRLRELVSSDRVMLTSSDSE